MMDNIVDYLVVGFFIISFLSSIFKKKKKAQQSSGKEVKTASNRSQQKVPSKQPKANSPFEDFFKSINNELANTKAEVSRSEVDEYYEQALQNSDNTGIANQDGSKEVIRSSSLIPEVVHKKNKSSISIKSYSDSVDFSKGKRENNKAKDLKKRLLDRKSIKDFIILNEVLGKPKALQR